MSRDTMVHVGVFLICTMTSQMVDTGAYKCTKDPKHDVDDDDAFCSSCGSKVQHVVTQEPDYQSLARFEQGDIMLQSVMEEEWLFNTFTHTDCVSLRFDGTQEVILYQPSNRTIGADADGVEEFDFNFALPSVEDIERLKLIVGYSEVIVKTGSVVSISY